MKIGTQLFVRNEFELSKPGTWMSWPIRAVLNLDNLNTGSELLRINHTATVSMDQKGNLVVIEAGYNKDKKRGEVISTLLDKWILSRKEGSFICKEPCFEFDELLLMETLDNQIGKPYGFFDVIIAQLVRIASRKKIWIGSNNLKTFYCSKLNAYAMHIASYGVKCSDFYTRDPEEHFNDKDFVYIVKN